MSVPITSLIALTSGAYANVNATIFSRGYSLQEDDSVTAGGIIVKWPNGTVDEYSAAHQPVNVGMTGGTGVGPLTGVPAGGMTPTATATQYCQVKSVSATSTLRLTEYN